MKSSFDGVNPDGNRESPTKYAGSGGCQYETLPLHKMDSHTMSGYNPYPVSVTAEGCMDLCDGQINCRRRDPDCDGVNTVRATETRVAGSLAMWRKSGKKAGGGSSAAPASPRDQLGQLPPSLPGQRPLPGSAIRSLEKR